VPGSGISALTVERDGSVWIPTHGGLARLDKEGHWQTYVGANFIYVVFALTLGQDGSVWIGTDGDGLGRLDKKGQCRPTPRPIPMAVCQGIS